jgi:hypothetical protein
MNIKIDAVEGINLKDQLEVISDYIGKDKKGNVITEKLKQPKKEMPEYVSIFHLHLYN